MTSTTIQNPEEKGEKHPFELQRIPLENPEYMNEVPERLQNKDIPGFPSTVAAVGPPGSGKTNVLMNLLTSFTFWRGFFDVIYALGPTVNSDKLYKAIDIPKNQKVVEEAEFMPKLVEWTTKQIKSVESNPDTAKKALFIFEDFTSYRHSIQNDPQFLKCFNAIRHHKATSLANIHKLTALERTARQCCMHIMIWPSNKSEVKALYYEYGTNDFTENDFHYICKFAWTPTEDNKKPFLYINRYAPQEDRFRKCFTEIINVKAFDGMHKRIQKEKKDQLKGTNGRQRPTPYSRRPAGQSRQVREKEKEIVPEKNPSDIFKIDPPSVVDNPLAFLH